jgi:transposase, IS5 family
MRISSNAPTRACASSRPNLGRVIRDIERRIVGNEGLREPFVRPLYLARRVLEQERRQRGRKVYSLHAPEVECIGKGKAHRAQRIGQISFGVDPLAGRARRRRLQLPTTPRVVAG